MIKRINILIIPHKQQAYETVGNWWVEGKTLEIRVSAANDIEFEAGVAVHELREALLCLARGIDEGAVTSFDLAYELKRLDGDEDSEPGDDPAAPYHYEHLAANIAEQVFIAAPAMVPNKRPTCSP